MSAILKRLEAKMDITPLKGGTKYWQFSEKLAKKKIDFFRHAVVNHGILTLEYYVLCSHLMHSCQNNADSEALEKQLIAALMLAEYLTCLYRDYLIVPREVERLQKEQAVYQQLLSKRGYTFDRRFLIDIDADKFSQNVRSYTALTNPPRLFLVRVKRLLEALLPFLKDNQRYGNFYAHINVVLKPTFTYLAWLFFAPRLVVNLFLLIKHVVPGYWMKDKEQELRWLCRLQAQLQRRWFELANDAIWMLAGLLGCFAWVGPLAPIGIYVNVALYAYDFFAAALRANLELSRLTKLTKDYEELYAQASADEKLEIAQYQEHLAKRVAFEQKKLLLSVINTGLLTLFICSTIPLIAVNPLVPLMGAAALVLVTICATAALKWLESKKPDDKPVPFFTKLNLFKPLSVNSNAEILLDGPNCHSLN